MKYGWNHQTQRLVAPKLENYGNAFGNTYKLIQDKLALEEKRKQVEEQRQFQIDRENQRHTWDTQRDTQIHDWKKEDMDTQYGYDVNKLGIKHANELDTISEKFKNNKEITRMNNDSAYNRTKLTASNQLNIAKMRERGANSRANKKISWEKEKAMLPYNMAEKQALKFSKMLNSDKNLQDIFSKSVYETETVNGDPIKKKDYNAASAEFDRKYPNKANQFTKLVKSIESFDGGKKSIPDYIKSKIGNLNKSDKNYDENVKKIIKDYFLSESKTGTFFLGGKNLSTNKTKTDSDGTPIYGRKKYNNNSVENSTLFKMTLKNTNEYIDALDKINNYAIEKNKYIEEFAPSVTVGYNKKQRINIANSVKNIDSNINNILNQMSLNAGNAVVQQALNAKLKYFQNEKKALIKEQNKLDVAAINLATATKQAKKARVTKVSEKSKAYADYIDNDALQERYTSFTDYWDFLKKR